MALLMAAAGVSPKAAGSNLSQWANLLGFDDLPQWLVNQSIDTPILWGSGGGLALLVVYTIWKRLSARNKTHLVTSRRQLRETLATFLATGSTLLASASNTNHPIPEGAFAVWVENIQRELRNSLDESYVVRLRDRTGVRIYSNPSYEPARRQVHADILLTMERLREFLRELSD